MKAKPPIFLTLAIGLQVGALSLWNTKEIKKEADS